MYIRQHKNEAQKNVVDLEIFVSVFRIINFKDNILLQHANDLFSNA